MLLIFGNDALSRPCRDTLAAQAGKEKANGGASSGKDDVPRSVEPALRSEEPALRSEEHSLCSIKPASRSVEPKPCLIHFTSFQPEGHTS
ncbi:MAG: hypothetical protein LBR88_04060 [Zoogloeaceae bacterium]|jgi:hypothetical protein|nr:hypothetical protein [Zoogloeaceae bacterium]